MWFLIRKKLCNFNIDEIIRSFLYFSYVSLNVFHINKSRIFFWHFLPDKNSIEGTSFPRIQIQITSYKINYKKGSSRLKAVPSRELTLITFDRQTGRRRWHLDASILGHGLHILPLRVCQYFKCNLANSLYWGFELKIVTSHSNVYRIR